LSLFVFAFNLFTISSFDFIEPEEMPRTTTGKILHRELRKKYGGFGV
jgi:acyl-CoA synthetase (AMP-forming)/AMP-acid ligase II